MHWGVVQRQDTGRFGPIRFRVRVLAPQLRSIPSGRVRTYVRATLRYTSGGCGRSRRRDVRRGLRNSACGRRGQLAHAAALRARGLGHPDRPLRRHAGTRRAGRIPAAARGGAGRGLDVRARQLKRRLYERAQAARVRAVRPGRGVARPPHGADPRSHQRRRGPTTGSRTCGSSARTAPRRSTPTADARTVEPLDPPLRACAARRSVAEDAGQRYCSQDCGQRCGTRGRPEPGAPAGAAAALRAVARGGGGAGLVSRRTQVRRQRQRGAQVDARVRACTCARRLRVSSGRRRLVRRPPRLALFMRIRTLAAAVAALLVPAAPAFAGDPTMPLWQVQAGMRCTGVLGDPGDDDQLVRRPGARRGGR